MKHLCPHHDKPVVAFGLCRSCYAKDLYRRNPAFAERQRANARKWRKTNPDKQKAKNRSRRLLRYGLTPEAYEEMLAAQGGGCAICGRKCGRHKLPVDHCHKTGKIRGILCNNCNRGLAIFHDDPELFLKASKYVSKLHFV